MTLLNPQAIKAGDTAPLHATLFDAQEDPLDLADCGVDLISAPATPGLGHPGFTSACEVLQSEVDGHVHDRGRVRYDSDEGETDIPAVYKLWFRITYPDGSTKTAPNVGFVAFEITPFM